MNPIGPLMHEHRLIERMIKLLDIELNAIKKDNKISPDFIDAVVDFFRTYADKTHHGKEEDILFRDLEKKYLTSEHKRILNELIEEHVYARKTVSNLLNAKEEYINGDNEALSKIIVYLEELTELYPSHITKEDKHFFFQAMEYFNKQKQDAMLQEFWEFDSKMIHDKYKDLIEHLEEKKQVSSYFVRN